MTEAAASAKTASRLRAAGERVTLQRMLVAEELAAAGRQVTAPELWRRLRRRGLGRATVFRTLETLVAAGVARRLEQENHVYGYVACAPQHHHHLSCASCGRVEEIGEAYIRPVADRVRAELGFEIDDARLDFYGRCARCRSDEAVEGAAASPLPLRAAADASDIVEGSGG